MELGRVLGKGPLPLDSVRVGDTASDAHPNAGATWSSTGSESACAVRVPVGGCYPSTTLCRNLTSQLILLM